MWKHLIHLWATPPSSLPLNCPPSPDGVTPDPMGFYDYETVAAAFNAAALTSAAIVALAVVICYWFTSTTLGPRFVRRWWITLVLAVLITPLAVATVLYRAPVRALADSCELSPNAFAEVLPFATIFSRSMAGMVWALLAMVALSVLLTATIGRIPHVRNGFFHNRGWPWPRILPTK
jgi:hypothetical protein